MSGYAIVPSAPVSTTSNAIVTNTATCPVGKKAIGGGFSETSGNSMHVHSEGPTTVNPLNTNDSWRIRAQRIGNNNATFTVTAICVSAL